MAITSSIHSLHKKLSSANGSSLSTKKRPASGRAQSTTKPRVVPHPALVSAGTIDKSKSVNENSLHRDSDNCSQPSTPISISDRQADTISQPKEEISKETHSDSCSSNVLDGETVTGEGTSNIQLRSKARSHADRQADTISQPKEEISKETHSDSCSSNVLDGETVTGEGTSNIQLRSKARFHADTDPPSPSEANTSHVEDFSNFCTDADLFLRVVKDAKKTKTFIQQHLDWDCCSNACIVPCGDTPPEQSKGKQSLTRKDREKKCLFFPYVPRILVTVHLLPCRFAFTGPAPVRKYFRPWRLPNFSIASPKEQLRRRVTVSAEKSSHSHQYESKIKTPLTSTPCNDGNDSRPLVSPQPNHETNKNAHHLKTPVNGGTSSNPPIHDDHSSLSEICPLTLNSEKGPMRKSEDDCASEKSFKGTVKVDKTHGGDGDNTTTSTSQRQLYEALLHGRLLRGMSLPLKHCKPNSRATVHEGPQAELGTEQNDYLTDSVQAYLVMRNPLGVDDSNGDDDHKGKRGSPLTDSDAGVSVTQQEVKTYLPLCSPAAHADTTVEQQRGFKGSAEFVPVARIGRLCYWNHDTLPTLEDDVPQALAFMQLARVVHSMTDDD